MFKKILKWGLLILLIGFIAIQFINRPDKTTSNEISQGDLTKRYNIPDSIQTILKRACYDCHSNQTKWPWYSQIAPVSWLLADDINKGRKKMNFSEWNKIPIAKQELRLNNICDQVREGEMPLPKYLIIHKEAVLTDKDKNDLCAWVNDAMMGL
ncbi:MAG: heme-binding domain-containing protein [Saprospiraceae bacterium]